MIFKYFTEDQTQVSYEEMQSMTYLDQILHETARRHSLLPLLSRASKDEYKIPGTNVVLPKGEYHGDPF